MDVGNVKDMSYMFYVAETFDQDIGNWNVENVNSMNSMFDGSNLSTENYDKVLLGLKEIDEEHGLLEEVTLGARGIKYTANSSRRGTGLSN